MQMAIAILGLATLLTGVSGDNLVQNPGFESGQLDPWAVAAGTWQVTDVDAHSGAFAAQTGDGTVYQPFAPIRTDEVTVVSFWIKATSPPPGPAEPFAYYSLDMYDDEGIPLLGAVPIPALSGDWEYWELTPSPRADHWLRGITIGTAGATGLLLDDVRVITAPEPAALAMIGLGALTLIRRRRRR
jgi:hypothetical protein